MNSRLEQFVRDHREEFDGEEPDRNIWDKVQRQMEPARKGSSQSSPGKEAPVRIPMRWFRFGAAAALILILAGGAWFFFGRGVEIGPAVAKDNKISKGQGATPNGQDDSSLRDPAGTTASSGTTPSRDQSASAGTPADKTHDNVQPDPGQQDMVQEEMYHYAKLVEIKHRELKNIEKEEPLLYRQFLSDVNKLDSVYQDLQKQLPSHPNRQQLLEAMLQNLQLQMGLLNHQLDIIKQINNSKKSAYEKAYKTT
jgi:hypothetical protein